MLIKSNKLEIVGYYKILLHRNNNIYDNYYAYVSDILKWFCESSYEVIKVVVLCGELLFEN